MVLYHQPMSVGLHTPQRVEQVMDVHVTGLPGVIIRKAL